MKNKLILLLFSLLTPFMIKSQINYADSTVQAITYWVLNENYTYEIIEGKTKSKAGELDTEGSLRSVVQITVIDSTETTYTIEWRFLEHSIPNFNITSEINTLLNKKKYIYKTNMLGEFEELVNWEEVRDNTLATTRALLDETMRQKNDVRNDSLIDLVNTFMETMMSKEYIEQKVIEPVNIFHTFFGSGYQLGEILESDMDISIPIFNLQSLKAHGVVWLESLDEEYSTYTLCYEQKIDREEVRKMLSQAFEELSGKFNIDKKTDSIDKILEGELDYLITVYSEFDNTGWPLNIISTANINIGNNKQNKKIQIRLIDY